MDAEDDPQKDPSRRRPGRAPLGGPQQDARSQRGAPIPEDALPPGPPRGPLARPPEDAALRKVPAGRPALDSEDARVLERAYARAVRLGFLGPRERERLWERHLDDALGLAAIRAPEPEERWADLGSGAGLPGLPLAVAHPRTSFTLIDAQQRRLDWIQTTVSALGLTNVAVVHERLEDYGHGPARATFDVATARALGPLPVVAELGLPLLRVGGLLLVPRGQAAAAELEQASNACELLGGQIVEVVPNPSSPIDRVGFVVIMAKIAATSPRFPRRSGVPARAPLGQQRSHRR